jgi:L-threonylcarbamoyladenylate synthase
LASEGDKTVTESGILAFDALSNQQRDLFERAGRIVRGGGVIIVATETFYALAAAVFNDEAVRRIFCIKGRPETKPLPLIASDRRLVEELAADAPALMRGLMDRFWPGSLTILFEPMRPVSPLLTGSGGKIGVRVPPPCPARYVAAGSGGWITATSANRSGEADPSTVGEIAKQVIDSVDLVVDSGAAPGGQPSTLVEPLAHDVRILRQGMVPEAAIAAFVAKWQIRR